MPAPKKSKAANDTTLPTPFLSALWDGGYAIADEARAEYYKQSAALISFVEGLSKGLIGLASKVNDRADDLSRDGLAAVHRGGRELVVNSQKLSAGLASSTVKSGEKLVATTRDGARSVGQRATASAQALLGSNAQDKAAKKAA